MIKHLLVPIPLLVLFFAGCDGWFVPCDQTHSQYCIETNGDDEGACGSEGIEKYYVWYLDGTCAGQSTSFCASADTAQSQADELLAGTTHGSVSTDPTATQPGVVSFCPTGSCVIGSADGSTMTSFSVFNNDPNQIAACELLFDPDQACSWPSPGTAGCAASL